VGIHKSLNKGKAAKSAHPLPKSTGKPAVKGAKPKTATPARTVVHKAMASAKVARPATRNSDILTKLRATPAKPIQAASAPAFKSPPAKPVAAVKAAQVKPLAVKPVALKPATLKPAAVKPAAMTAMAASAPAVSPPAAAARSAPGVSAAATAPLGATVLAGGSKFSAKPLDKKVPLMPSAALKVVKTEKPELKMEAKKKLEFRSQDWVVYPAHGVGRIVSIEENEVAGMKLELFVISFEKDKMTLRVPVAKARAVGMRRLSSPDVVQSALATLKGRARIKRTMWSRRAQEYEQKIHSGDLISIAEVVRDLHRANGQPEQSYSERQLYEAAIGRLAREVAAVERIDELAAMKRLETALVKAAA
jgi:CarD family transcriptional regulator